MQIKIRGNKIDITDSMKEYVKEKLSLLPIVPEDFKELENESFK